MTLDGVILIVELSVLGLGTVAMLVALIRYLLLDDARKMALRSEPTQMIGLSRGEEILRWTSVLGIAAGLFSVPWWPRRGSPPVVEASDTLYLLAYGIFAWLAVAAVLLRRLIYKRWI
jgi:hypothetical protein